MRILILDFSPILYSNFISASTEMKNTGLKLDPVTKKLDINAPGYKNIIKYKIFEELSTLKHKFQTDEIVIAADNSKGNYWRKDVYPIYKGKRKDSREESELDWDNAFPIFEEIKQIIDDFCSFKLINQPKTEGDDVMFVLSEYLSLQGDNVILHSIDHDTVYNLKHPGVEWYRHVKTTKKPGEFQKVTPGEIIDLELTHLIQGDHGDNILNLKSYSRFSNEFKKLYPDKTELEVYQNRFKLDDLFQKKYGVSAYNHPRYGYKMFQKSKKTLDELLKENNIYKENYNLNKQIALPEGIPQEISQKIIQAYKNAKNNSNYPKLQDYFLKNDLINLIGKLPLF